MLEASSMKCRMVRHWNQLCSFVVVVAVTLTGHGSQQGTFESAEEGWVYSGQWLQNRMRLGSDKNLRSHYHV